MSALNPSRQPSGHEGSPSVTSQRGDPKAEGVFGMASSSSENVAWSSPASPRRLTQPSQKSDLLATWSVPATYSPAHARPSRLATVMEVLTSLSGLGLAGFMVMHMVLLSSVLLGLKTMNTLANFLEANYLLQIGAVILILLGLTHIALTLRKAPITFRQQVALVRQISWLRHTDTWTWAFQVASGLALLVLGTIHLWVILPDLPIQAAKSGGRVFGAYLWFYIPFVLIVEGHASIGLYRIAVKWGLVSRHWTHVGLNVWTVIVLVVGFAILATFYMIGRGL